MTKRKNVRIVKGILVTRYSNCANLTRVLAVVQQGCSQNCVKCRFYKLPTNGCEDIPQDLRRRILNIVRQLGNIKTKKQYSSNRNVKRKLYGLKSVVSTIIEYFNVNSGRSEKGNRCRNDCKKTEFFIIVKSGNFRNKRLGAATIAIEKQIGEDSGDLHNLRSSESMIEDQRRNSTELDSPQLELKKSQKFSPKQETNKPINNKTEINAIRTNKSTTQIEGDIRIDTEPIKYLESKLRRLKSDESRLYLNKSKKYGIKATNDLNGRRESRILEISGEPYPILNEISVSEIKSPKIRTNQSTLTVIEEEPKESLLDRQQSLTDIEADLISANQRYLGKLQEFRQKANVQYEIVNLPDEESEGSETKLEEIVNLPDYDSYRIDKKLPKRCQRCPKRTIDQYSIEVPEMNCCCCYCCQGICTII